MTGGSNVFQEALASVSVVWRDKLMTNCPLCDAALSMPSELEGEEVVCPICKDRFVACGIGLMTTEARRAYLSERLMDVETDKIESFLKYGSEVDAALRIGFKMGGRQCLFMSEPDGVIYPQKGFYLKLWFKIDIRPWEPRLRDTLKSAIGYALSPTEMNDKEVVYFIQKSCSPAITKESVRKFLSEPFEKNANGEFHRCTYLIKGDTCEELYIKNYQTFCDFLVAKYGKNYSFKGIYFEGLPDYDVVLTLETEDGPPPPEFIKDIENRLKRRLKMVFSSAHDYTFAVLH